MGKAGAAVHAAHKARRKDSCKSSYMRAIDKKKKEAKMSRGKGKYVKFRCNVCKQPTAQPQAGLCQRHFRRWKGS